MFSSVALKMTEHLLFVLRGLLQDKIRESVSDSDENSVVRSCSIAFSALCVRPRSQAFRPGSLSETTWKGLPTTQCWKLATLAKWARARVTAAKRRKGLLVAMTTLMKMAMQFC